MSVMPQHDGRALPATRQKSAARRTGPRTYDPFIPHQFLQLLGKASIAELKLGDSIETNMTIMFSDIRGFTSLSESMTAHQNFDFINSYLAQMEPVLFGRHGFIDKYIGDAIMALFPRSADDALSAATGMLNCLKRFNATRERSGTQPIHIGVGLNTGVMMAGTVGGRHRMETTVISDAVNLASRIESMTKIYGVPLLISEYTYYSLGRATRQYTRFVDRVRIRGKEQPQSVYEVFAADPVRQRAAKHKTRRQFEEALAHYHFREIPKAQKLLKRCLAQCAEDHPARVYMERCQKYLETGVHEATGELGLALEWNQAFEIGDPLIDAQHRTLFQCVNDFVATMRRSRSGTQVKEVIGALRRNVDEHFETEERIMREKRYPLLDLQRGQHVRFSKQFAELEGEIRSRLTTEKLFLLFRAQLLVVDWLVNHTVKLDRHFGKYLKGMS